MSEIRTFPLSHTELLSSRARKLSGCKNYIGDGKGKNWWCVLFPPLCLVSSSDKGLSLDSPQEAEVTFKCLELIPKGIRLKSAD
jgi:stage II sporulation protein R